MKIITCYSSLQALFFVSSMLPIWVILHGACYGLASCTLPNDDTSTCDFRDPGLAGFHRGYLLGCYTLDHSWSAAALQGRIIPKVLVCTICMLISTQSHHGLYPGPLLIGAVHPIRMKTPSVTRQWSRGKLYEECLFLSSYYYIHESDAYTPYRWSE